MAWYLMAVLGGCSGGPDPFDHPIPERPATFVDPRIDGTSAQPPLQLWRMPGRYDLPPSTLPAGFTPKSAFPIAMEERPSKERKQTNLFRGPSPFGDAVEQQARVGPPPGMALFVGDEEVPYHANLMGKSWRIAGDRLLVAWPGDELPPVSVTYTEVERLLHRRDFGSAGLPAEAFVRYEVTLEERTRDGMLLPAPGKAEWDVTLPTGKATFEAWLALAPLPLENLASDGAYAELTVVAGGEETRVDRRFVKYGASAFAEWRVDLSRWAGQQVTVRLSTDPYDTPDFDAVFLGSPVIWGPPAAPEDVRHVIVIGLDTTRPDHFGFYGYDRPTTPELDEVARTSTVFDRTWAPAPRTRPSFRSAFTGRRPLDAVGAPNIAEIFQRHGFATAGIVANIHLQPRFEFNDGFDDWWYDGVAKADQQVDRALDFLRRNADRDTFLFLHVMDPHLFYNPPGRLRDLFVTDPDPDLPEQFTRWDVYDWMRRGRVDDRRREHLKALYDAELRFTSQELGRFFDQLDRLQGRTLVVVHSDHGEEFWEHGAFEHNHTLYDETTRALLWFRSGPGQSEGRRIPAPATLADIGPTLIDFAGFSDPPPTDGRSLAPLLLGEEDPAAWADRELGVAHLRYGKERWGVVVRGKKYILHTASGEEELYDLDADPGETKNLAVSTPLAPFREALARAHGMKVGRGWRIKVTLEPGSPPVRIQLPVEALEAGIVDPEAATESPANEEWGERPKRTREDIGALTLSEDRRTVEFVPGPKPDGGILYVLFDGEVDPAQVALQRGGADLLTIGTRGQVTWRSGRDAITVQPGTIVIPPPDEATRMRALRGEGFDEASAEHAELCLLGYVECEPEKDGHGEGAAPSGQEGH